MGLDLVEFALDVEEEFDIKLPDQDLQPLLTPRMWIDYLTAHLAKDGRKVWTREEIAEIVHRHICDNFGLCRDQYTEDSRFVQDLGVE